MPINFTYLAIPHIISFRTDTYCFTSPTSQRTCFYAGSTFSDLDVLGRHCRDRSTSGQYGRAWMVGSETAEETDARVEVESMWMRGWQGMEIDGGRCISLPFGYECDCLTGNYSEELEDGVAYH